MKIGSREITAAPYVPENPRISRPLSAAARKPSNVLHRWSHRSRALDSTSDDSISLRSFTTAKSWQPTGDCPLFKLPAEINFEILSYLSYPEARQLKNTCRFFRMYITPGELLRYQTMWKTELLTLDVAGIFETSPAQPCYTCVRLRPKAAFPRRLAASTGSTLASSPTRCSERACIDCSWKTQKKGGTIWIEEKAWTRCNWCGRAGKAYRFDAADHQPALCGLCGRTRRLTVIWPAVLIHMAEMSVALCCIVWASWGSVQGWLVGYPDDNDWDKRKTVEVIVNVVSDSSQGFLLCTTKLC